MERDIHRCHKPRGGDERVRENKTYPSPKKEKKAQPEREWITVRQTGRVRAKGKRKDNYSVTDWTAKQFDTERDRQ